MLSRLLFTRATHATRITLTRGLATGALPDIQLANLEVRKTTSPKPKTPKEKLAWGTSFSDHMLEVDWEEGKGWGNPVIRPFGSLEISPASTVLHYAQQCFEGLKAYEDADGKLRLFRPDMNMKRLKRSMDRLVLPDFDDVQFLECIKELVRLDRDWVPKGEGYSLYIRPTGIGNVPSLAIGPSEIAKLFVILSPVGPYYPEGFNPIKLLVDNDYIRAWPGGTGAQKLGGNYAPGVRAQKAAGLRGYSQNLWVYGPDHEITEVGSMNLFVHWVNEDGENELITAPLTRGDILPGVTRDSILQLTREWDEFKVSEKNVTMKRIRQAAHEGRLLEVFGSGTAAIISPVSAINYQGEDLSVPLTGTNGKSGSLAERLWQEISDIQYGRKGDHPWSVVID